MRENKNITYSPKRKSDPHCLDRQQRYGSFNIKWTEGDSVIVKYAGNDKYFDYELQKTVTIEYNLL